MEKNIIVASGPVIIEEEKVLLNKHGDDSFWKFPGGRAEFFEFNDNTQSLEEICCVKVKKEMGLDVKIVKSLKPMMLPKPGDPETWIILIHFLANRIGEIKPGPEIIEWKWFDINNLPEDCAPNIKPIIADSFRQE